jgi:hypothetical protein
MKNLGLVLVLCGAAGLALLPTCADAFEIQGEGDRLSSDTAAAFESLNQNYVPQEFNGQSLAMPYDNKSSSFGSGFVSDYGNSIPIPGPGIDQPAPAWAYHGN